MGEPIKFIIFEECDEEVLSNQPEEEGTPKITPRQFSSDSLSSFLTDSLNDDKKRKKAVPFTREEDYLIRQLVEEKRNGKLNWQIIANEFNELLNKKIMRKASELYQRWNRVLNPDIKKGFWTPNDDEKLILLLNKNEISYSKFAQEMGDRTDTEIRYRIQMKLHQWIKCGKVERQTNKPMM